MSDLIWQQEMPLRDGVLEIERVAATGNRAGRFSLTFYLSRPSTNERRELGQVYRRAIDGITIINNTMTIVPGAIIAAPEPAVFPVDEEVKWAEDMGQRILGWFAGKMYDASPRTRFDSAALDSFFSGSKDYQFTSEYWFEPDELGVSTLELLWIGRYDTDQPDDAAFVSGAAPETVTGFRYNAGNEMLVADIDGDIIMTDNTIVGGKNSFNMQQNVSHGGSVRRTTIAGNTIVGGDESKNIQQNVDQMSGGSVIASQTVYHPPLKK